MRGFAFAAGAAVLLLGIGVAVAATRASPKEPDRPKSPTADLVQLIGRLIAAGDSDLTRAQLTWLTDNGYPETASALNQYLEGNITEQQLRAVAMNEAK